MASPNTILNRFREPAKRIIPRRFRAPLNRAYFWALSLHYRGGARWCPCCERAVKEFLPYSTYGKAPAPGAQCPACGALARHRLAWQVVRTRTDLGSAPRRVLHFAPEPILQRRLRDLPQVEYLSADIDSPLAMVQMDITEIPEADASFDGVICSHVLAHVRDDRRAMAEVRRVLRPGGWAIIQTTIDARPETFEDPRASTPEQRRAAYGQVDLWRIYGQDLVERLEGVGFGVTTIDRDDIGDAATADRLGLDHAPLHFCVRPG